VPVIDRSGDEPGCTYLKSPGRGRPEQRRIKYPSRALSRRPITWQRNAYLLGNDISVRVAGRVEGAQECRVQGAGLEDKTARYRSGEVNLNTIDVAYAKDLRSRLHARSSDLSGYAHSPWGARRARSDGYLKLGARGTSPPRSSPATGWVTTRPCANRSLRHSMNRFLRQLPMRTSADRRCDDRSVTQRQMPPASVATAVHLPLSRATRPHMPSP
jgi:hypothetical protein